MYPYKPILSIIPLSLAIFLFLITCKKGQFTKWDKNQVNTLKVNI